MVTAAVVVAASVTRSRKCGTQSVWGSAWTDGEARGKLDWAVRGSTQRHNSAKIVPSGDQVRGRTCLELVGRMGTGRQSELGVQSNVSWLLKDGDTYHANCMLMNQLYI